MVQSVSGSKLRPWQFLKGQNPLTAPRSEYQKVLNAAKSSSQQPLKAAGEPHNTDASARKAQDSVLKQLIALRSKLSRLHQAGITKHTAGDFEGLINKALKTPEQMNFERVSKQLNTADKLLTNLEDQHGQKEINQQAARKLFLEQRKASQATFEDAFNNAIEQEQATQLLIDGIKTVAEEKLSKQSFAKNSGSKKLNKSGEFLRDLFIFEQLQKLPKSKLRDQVMKPLQKQFKLPEGYTPTSTEKAEKTPKMIQKPERLKRLAELDVMTAEQVEAERARLEAILELEKQGSRKRFSAPVKIITSR
ncbi:MAG: hypothetical protein VKJ06_02095 [Vampirovibrionales bacterium]|nr:hypothetical protein [Vampirovibrionales bacterium]